MMNNQDINCPYCGKSVQNDIHIQSWVENVSEILTVPVLERVGKLATTSNWVSKKKDPRLGGLLSVWNKTVGLLRAYNQLDVNVMKRELYCTGCQAPFDCYVNLGQNHSFNDFWPHLTGNVDQSGQFTSSSARSLAEKLSSLGENIGISSRVSIVFLVLFFCFATLLSYYPFTLQNTMLIYQAIVRCASALLVAIMLWSVKLLTEYIRESFEAFQDIYRLAFRDCRIFQARLQLLYPWVF